jgi:hypothetical protein
METDLDVNGVVLRSALMSTTQLPYGECIHSDFSVLQVPCQQHQQSVVPVLQAACMQVMKRVYIR